ncbi:MAG: membrane protein insertion efficiency factor YidD [Limisphaerales bacterium]
MKNTEHPTSAIEHPTLLRSCAHWMLDVPKTVLMFVIRLYRWTISPAQIFLFGSTAGCRFTPTCSRYAMDAIRERGVFKGTILAAKRICRCHPWGGCGHDPVKFKMKPQRTY